MNENEKEQIAKLLKKTKLLEKLKEEEIAKFIEIPPSSDFGDFAVPCFSLAKILKTPPHEIALEIRKELGNLKLPPEFSSVETQGAYLNFFINKKQLAEKTIDEILKLKDNYGSVDIGKGKKALIEHTSINPNASPHVGRARNAIIGDSIVRILKFLNYKTEVHYYVNDVSKQIAMLVLAKADKLKFEALLKKYIEISGKVKKSKKLEAEVFKLLKEFENGNKEIVSKFNKVTKTAVNGQEKILSELGIHYDAFDYESDYLRKSSEVLKELGKTNKLLKDKDGRYYIDQKGTLVEGKMKSPVLVLTRSDNTGLYPLRDLAYTIEKLKMSPINLIILGEDQKLYFEQISEALKLLNYTPPKVVHYSFILLHENRNSKKSKKMSTRKGDVVLLEDFMRDATIKAKKKAKANVNSKKIAAAAVKYSILKNHPNKIIMFNLDDALNFEGDTGPYMLYSYARASSILKKSKKKHKTIHRDEKQGEKENLTELIKKLSQFPDIVLKAYNDLNPSYIANYSYELAKIFNEFYHFSPVIGSEDEIFKLKLVESFRQVLKNSLFLLGIEVVEEM